MIYTFKEGPHTDWNKDDLGSGIKIKTSNLPLQKYLNMLYSGQYEDFYYSAGAKYNF